MKYNQEQIRLAAETIFIEKMITEVYPSGIVSLVCDSFDFWSVLSKSIPKLKDKIMARDGKLVCRPDTGDPVRIVCGYDVDKTKLSSEQILTLMGHSGAKKLNFYALFENHDCLLTSDNKYFTTNGEISKEEARGAIDILWDLFGGITNDKGYKELDPHIGLIYGDSITYERCGRICELLEYKGFASTNVVFGIGSYTYQYNTRDTFSIACKATWVQIKGEAKPIFKDPKTDNGTKKSAKGLLKVVKENGKLVLIDNVTPEEEETGELVTIFEDGKLLVDQSLSEIRSRLC